VTLDERTRVADHADSCWDGCDDLHPDECGFCGRPDCEDDCVGNDASWVPKVVTEYGFEREELL
jgi:hypothetical protein